MGARKQKVKGKKIKNTKLKGGGHGFVDRMIALLPAALTGKPDELARRYRGARTSGDADAIITEIRRRTASYYLLLILALVLCGIMLAQQTMSDDKISDVARSDAGDNAKYVDARVDAVYGDTEINRDVSVIIQPKELTAEETVIALEDLKQRLPGMVCGENSDLSAVNADLNLSETDEKTGATIVWRSDREAIIDTEGHVNLIDGKPGEKVNLTADITLGEVTDSLALNIVMAPAPGEYDFVRDLENSIANLAAEISGSTEGDTITLPGKTDSGIDIAWSKPGGSGLPFALVIIPVIGFVVFRGRYRAMDKAVSAMRDSIRRDFPDFLSKLLLLLNAGLTSTSAVEKIAYDYREHRRAGEEKVFFEELLGMEERIRGANTSLAVEFTDLAARSGRREVMRFSSILADNIDKGNALAEKLAQEENMLRTMRKKNAEEKGRLAETKLTFPMALQLGAIIIITVAPAAFEMQ